MMEYVTLHQAARELDLPILNLVERIQQYGVSYYHEQGKLHLCLNDYFAWQRQQLELDPSALSDRELAALVSFYAQTMQETEEMAMQETEVMGREETEINSRALDSIITLLVEEQPARLQGLVQDDFVYSRVQEMYPDLLRTVPLGSREKKGKYEPNPWAVKAGIKRQARGIADKVSKYFDTDIPGQIRMSKGRKNYASITYKRRLFFGAAPAVGGE